jgi:hypothetical protein
MEQALKGKEAIFSYLNAENLSLVVEKRGNIAQRSDLKTQFAVPITLDELLVIHGHPIKPNKAPTSETFQLELAQMLLEANVNNPDDLQPLLNWVRGLPNPSIKPEWKANKALLDVKSPDLPVTTTSGKSIREIKSIWKFDAVDDVVKWFKGIWLEECVLDVVKSLQAQAKFQQPPVKSVEPLLSEATAGEFEIDIVALQGYRLFALSVTTDVKKGMCKLKLFEALARARQMGGDEARVALLCFSDNPEEIQKEVGELWQMNDQVKVFGKKHFENLADHLREWFQQGIS